MGRFEISHVPHGHALPGLTVAPRGFPCWGEAVIGVNAYPT
jgi:hypothetical protein